MIVFVLSWLYPILAIIIKVQSKGPVIFRQKREGKNGTHFTCFKFRSMILNDESDQKWATLNDPRLTKVGSFLRKTSLDEFPQFINVLLGDMSIVGPRPHAVLMNDSYRNVVEKFAQRHNAKPGVTGLSQTRGLRGEITEFHDITARVKLDRFYLSKWNFILDLNIIAQTMYVLIKGDEKAF
jgi:putative colanic acid biosynthesis UDP-glucose lipid carrier transferase